MPLKNPSFINNCACKWHMLTIQRYELCFLYDMVMVVADSNNLKHNGRVPIRTTSKKKSHFFLTPVHRESHSFFPPQRNTTCQKSVHFCSTRGYEENPSSTKYWRRQHFGWRVGKKGEAFFLPKFFRPSPLLKLAAKAGAPSYSYSEKNPFDQRAKKTAFCHSRNYRAGIIFYPKIIGQSDVRVGTVSLFPALLFLVWLLHQNQKTKLFLRKQSDLFPRTWRRRGTSWDGTKTKFFYADEGKSSNPPQSINLKTLVENFKCRVDVELKLKLESWNGGVEKKASSNAFELVCAFEKKRSFFSSQSDITSYMDVSKSRPAYPGVQKATLLKTLLFQPSYKQPFSRSALLRGGRMHKSRKKLPNLCITFAGHPQNWFKISKISLHATSNKLLFAQPDFYTPFNLAFCCFSMQTPRMINSRRSISTFKLLKGVFIGVKSHLRRATSVAFCYKWFYLAAGARNNSSSQMQSALFNTCLGIDNVFVYPELDRLNYSLFEPVPGFDIAFFFAGRDKLTLVNKK